MNPEQFHRFVAGLLVVARAALTWLIVAASVVTVFADELARVAAGDEVLGEVVAWALRAAAVIGAAVTAVRRHTQVPANLRGVTGPAVAVIPRQEAP